MGTILELQCQCDLLRNVSQPTSQFSLQAVDSCLLVLVEFTVSCGYYNLFPSYYGLLENGENVGVVSHSCRTARRKPKNTPAARCATSPRNCARNI